MLTAYGGSHIDGSVPVRMKAIVAERYGPPGKLRVGEIDVPPLEPDRVLVRVTASSLNAYDWHIVRGRPYFVRLFTGLRRPSRAVPGVDLAGIVTAVGESVTNFKAGDEVFGARDGAWAMYANPRERSLAHKPAEISFETAAVIPCAGTTALQAVRRHGRLQAGEAVLVNGAAGGVGTFTVQIAKALGADHLTAVCSARNVDFVRSLGADEVIAYDAEDFTKTGGRFDLIVDVAGTRPVRRLERLLTAQGRIVMVGSTRTGDAAVMARIVQRALRQRFSGGRVRSFTTTYTQDDFATLAELVSSGRVRPQIERVVPLEEVPAALSYVEAGHPRAKIAVTV